MRVFLYAGMQGQKVMTSSTEGQLAWTDCVVLGFVREREKMKKGRRAPRGRGTLIGAGAWPRHFLPIRDVLPVALSE